jgi:hypothetical protein
MFFPKFLMGKIEDHYLQSFLFFMDKFNNWLDVQREQRLICWGHFQANSHGFGLILTPSGYWLEASSKSHQLGLSTGQLWNKLASPRLCKSMDKVEIVVFM